MDHRHSDPRKARGEQHQLEHEPAFGWYPHTHKTLDSKDLWVTLESESGGHYGRRCANTLGVLATTAHEMLAAYGTGTLMVHDGRCNLGRTTPDPCDCYPEKLVQQWLVVR